MAGGAARTTGCHRIIPFDFFEVPISPCLGGGHEAHEEDEDGEEGNKLRKPGKKK
jgi:hypothetical protein